MLPSAARELSQRTYPQIGVTEQHHSVSHHGNDANKIAQNVKINLYHMGLFAKFLDKLRAAPDGDGSILDHSLIFYGGGMGNPNGHLSDPLPVVAIGGGVGKGHRHIELPTRTPIGNLWLSVAQDSQSDVRDSTGTVVFLTRRLTQSQSRRSGKPPRREVCDETRCARTKERKWFCELFKLRVTLCSTPGWCTKRIRASWFLNVATLSAGGAGAPRCREVGNVDAAGPPQKTVAAERHQRPRWTGPRAHWRRAGTIEIASC